MLRFSFFNLSFNNVCLVHYYSEVFSYKVGNQLLNGSLTVISNGGNQKEVTVMDPRSCIFVYQTYTESR